MKISEALATLVDSPLKSLQIISILAFLICTLATLFFWIFSETSSINNFQLPLFIIGATLLFMIMTLNSNMISTVLVTLIIGAFIVPTEDLIRFALIATGSDRPMEDLYHRGESSSKSSNMIDRQDTRLRLAAYFDGLDIHPSDRRLLLDGVLCFMENEEIRNAAQRANIMNVAGLMQKINESDSPAEISNDYSDESTFRQDMEFLRSEGLIDYQYNDYSSVSLTYLGRYVNNYLNGDGAGDYLPNISVGGVTCSESLRSAAGVNFRPSLPPLPSPEAIVDLTMSNQPVTEHISSNQYAYFRIEASERSRATIQVSGIDQFDPVAFLLDEGKLNSNEEGVLVAFNDDAPGDGQDSFIQQTLNQGTYIVAVHGYRMMPGSFSLALALE